MELEVDPFVSEHTRMYVIVHPQNYVYNSGIMNEEEEDESSNNSCVSFIDETILPRQKNLPKFFAQRLSRMAVTLAGITLAVTFVIALLAFLVSQTTASSAAFGFGFDSVFTSLSSFLIIWRFWSIHSTVREIARKETLTTIAVATSMVISAACIFTRAFQSIKASERPTQMTFVIAVSASSGVAYFALFFAKYRVAVRMGSAALMTDAIDALSGGVLALALLISSSILKYSQTVWFLDSSIAMVIAAFSVCYGVTVLVRMLASYRDREIAVAAKFYVVDKF
ncbi:transmembrane protein 163-like [Dendronephthya gigantea]|uniref:transmembrane protein 163-like n=1 Tax=Dendronephthya gigantea TaxID=151771 RepID=UPI00106B5DCB|nr:transmembrane protein 163-like [Dendronephthya gigantea]